MIHQYDRPWVKHVAPRMFQSNCRNGHQVTVVTIQCLFRNRIQDNCTIAERGDLAAGLGRNLLAKPAPDPRTKSRRGSPSSGLKKMKLVYRVEREQYRSSEKKTFTSSSRTSSLWNGGYATKIVKVPEGGTRSTR